VDIKLERNDFDERSRCQLCGSLFELDDIVARAYTDNGDYITDVCSLCLTSGEAGIRQRLQAHATHLRAIADRLDALSREDMTVPSPEHIQVIRQIAKALL
jgi:hypothetical protein